ncbi:NAD(P)-dependent oxidoreductase [Rosenbergiella epipactidis]|uniref:NAD(P)-dependent oxidoreductase n=1 Tax=Rosenbergiella epipactidis TaxID=1544694 RepID=UPI001F4D7415|nr:NAD(P)-dependent oxidoreductase [Rosenbergiella epipactidis]
MKPTIIQFMPLPDDLVNKLTDHFEVVEVDNLDQETVTQHAEAFSKAEGLIGSGGKVNEALLAQMPALKVCSTVSAGYDSYDVGALTHHKAILTNTPGALTETVADAMMALVLCAARNIPAMDQWVKTGGWDAAPEKLPLAIDVHHKKMGIIGMGRIGLALAKRAHHGFGMGIIYNARKPHKNAEQEVNAQYASVEQLLAEADFVCVVLPLTDETHHLISHAQFDQMKESAILVNAGRGPVVDEEALIAALKAKKIYGAGLDVFEKEPLVGSSELTKLPNVVTLPHIGSATHETRYAMKRDGVENLILGLQGKLTENIINPEALKA